MTPALEALLQGGIEESDRLYQENVDFIRDMNLISVVTTYQLSGRNLPDHARALLDERFLSQNGTEEKA